MYTLSSYYTLIWEKNRLSIPTPILIPTKVVRLTTVRSRMTIEKIAVIKVRQCWLYTQTFQLTTAYPTSSEHYINYRALI